MGREDFFLPFLVSGILSSLLARPFSMLIVEINSKRNFVWESTKLCLWHEMSEEHETIISKQRKQQEMKIIRAAGNEQKSIATQPAFKSLDRNPQFLNTLTAIDISTRVLIRFSSDVQ